MPCYSFEGLGVAQGRDLEPISASVRVSPIFLTQSTLKQTCANAWTAWAILVWFWILPPTKVDALLMSLALQKLLQVSQGRRFWSYPGLKGFQISNSLAAPADFFPHFSRERNSTQHNFITKLKTNHKQNDCSTILHPCHHRRGCRCSQCRPASSRHCWPCQHWGGEWKRLQLELIWLIFIRSNILLHEAYFLFFPTIGFHSFLTHILVHALFCIMIFFFRHILTDEWGCHLLGPWARWLQH